MLFPFNHRSDSSLILDECDHVEDMERENRALHELLASVSGALGTHPLREFIDRRLDEIHDQRQ